MVQTDSTTENITKVTHILHLLQNQGDQMLQHSFMQ